MAKPHRTQVSVVVVNKGKILGIETEDPHSKRRYFFLPGGLVEAGEAPQDAAVRKTREETGFQISLIDGVAITRRYDFDWNGETHDCTTFFLGGRLVNETPSQVNLSASWKPVSEISELFSYHKDILEPVKMIATSTVYDSRKK